MGVSLVEGWLPVVLFLLGTAVAVFLLVRPLRWWWQWVVPTVAVASGLLSWVISTVVATNLFAEALPFTVGVWIAMAIGAICLAIGHQFLSPWWEKVAAIVAAVLMVAAAGDQINIHFQQYPRLGDLLGATSDQQIVGPPPVDPTSSTTPSRPTGALADTWTPAGSGIPEDGKGKVSEITLPGTESGFQARPGMVYYPPAYFADNPEPLPVLILLTGQPGDPGDWFLGDRVQSVMNDFAAAHSGIAPIVVSPDPLGSTTANPLCANSSLGQLDTYLAKDVPAAIKQQLRVDPDPRHWAVGGFSYGGTCAIQLATNHPDTYPTFIDISGEVEPTLGSRQQTVDTAFGGDQTAFAAINPIDIMAHQKFPNSAGWFIVGSEDTDFETQQRMVYQAAQKAGMKVQFWESSGTGHDWATSAAGLRHAMPLLGRRLNLTQ